MKLKTVFLNVSSAAVSSLIAVQAFAQAATTQAVVAPQQVPAGAATTGTTAGPAWINFALMGGIILFMWLFVFRPQSKRAKEQKEFLSSLTPGIEVITAGGIIGTIVEVKENIVSINVGGSTMRVVKSSISGRLDASSSIPATK
ncbi:preprotein translocase subunit YajC [Silvanigrella aquatica]|uniref:preprotein translocase subunit YajC n=1 Tax=Silvanigrella aquatica TaxID=1915309 RepID=UPI000B22A68B|nr:preprotein translocase subunit YajC [Silvanigrella aquatica]